MTVIMVDGEAIDVPAIKQRYPHHPVAGYVTGGWPVEWSEADFALFARKIRVSQQPSASVDEASDARVLDVETGAATFSDWPLFYDSRTQKERATCYCDLSNVPKVIEACNAAGVPLPPRWWLAWYWGKPGAPTRDEVLAELHSLTGVELDPETLWACQYVAYGQWDLNIVYGTPDFARS